MKNKIPTLSLYYLLVLFMTSCSPNISKIIEKGHASLNRGDYDKAIKKFDKAAGKAKVSNDKAYHGLALAYEGKRNIALAADYEYKAHKANDLNPEYCYNIARYNAYSGNKPNAYAWLYHVGFCVAKSKSFRSMDHYINQASGEPFFESLEGDEKFYRFLNGGYRRVKIQIESGKSSESDKFTQNDQFAVVSAYTVSGKNKVILATDVIQDDNSANFYNEYVIFDYKLGTDIVIGQYDEDYTSHDLLSYFKGPLPGNLTGLTKTSSSRNSSLSFSVTDSDSRTYTSGTSIPATISTKEILLGLGAAALVIAASELSAGESRKKNLSYGDYCTLDVDYEVPADNYLDKLFGNNKYKAIFVLKILDGKYGSGQVRAEVTDIQIGYGRLFNSLSKIKGKSRAYNLLMNQYGHLIGKEVQPKLEDIKCK